MDLNQLTEKAQEAFRSAQTRALRLGHVEVDVEHLALALLEQTDGLFPRLLRRMEVDVDGVRRDLEAELERRPRQSGGGVEAGKLYVSRRAIDLIDRASKEKDRLKDDYISVEQLVLDVLQEADDAPIARG